MMIGGGLNDAGALMQSDVGLVISNAPKRLTNVISEVVSYHDYGLALILHLTLKNNRNERPFYIDIREPHPGFVISRCIYLERQKRPI